MLRKCDPAGMSPEARLAEIGALLVRGWRRSVQNGQKGIDGGGQVERACASAAVDAAENPKEVA
jgi:hypothetical protein